MQTSCQRFRWVGSRIGSSSCSVAFAPAAEERLGRNDVGYRTPLPATSRVLFGEPFDERLQALTLSRRERNLLVQLRHHQLPDHPQLPLPALGIGILAAAPFPQRTGVCDNPSFQAGRCAGKFFPLGREIKVAAFHDLQPLLIFRREKDFFARVLPHSRGALVEDRFGEGIEFFRALFSARFSARLISALFISMRLTVLLASSRNVRL